MGRESSENPVNPDEIIRKADDAARNADVEKSLNAEKALLKRKSLIEKERDAADRKTKASTARQTARGKVQDAKKRGGASEPYEVAEQTLASVEERANEEVEGSVAEIAELEKDPAVLTKLHEAALKEDVSRNEEKKWEAQREAEAKERARELKELEESIDQLAQQLLLIRAEDPGFIFGKALDEQKRPFEKTLEALEKERRGAAEKLKKIETSWLKIGAGGAQSNLDEIDAQIAAANAELNRISEEGNGWINRFNNTRTELGKVLYQYDLKTDGKVSEKYDFASIPHRESALYTIDLTKFFAHYGKEESRKRT